MRQEIINQNSMLAISDKEFKKLSEFIYQKFGIYLSDAKKPLLLVRLQKQVKKLGLSSFEEYYNYIVNDPTKQSLSELVNKISTNFTYFNRESAHFEHLAGQALPFWKKELSRRGSNDLRVWCAGCSSGEEAYYLNMLINDALGGELPNWNAGLLATDISEQVLNKAKLGVYPKQAIEKLPTKFQKLHFDIRGNEAHVKNSVKNSILFRRYNLLNEDPPFQKKFQIIFCRNVMIYFDNKTRKDVVSRFVDLLEPGGFLYIGHSETIGNSFPQMKFVIPACYQKGDK